MEVEKSNLNNEFASIFNEAFSDKFVAGRQKSNVANGPQVEFDSSRYQGIFSVARLDTLHREGLIPSDVENLKVSFPKGSYNYVYKVSYKFDNKNYVKYVYEKRTQRNVAVEMAKKDASVDKSDLSNSVIKALCTEDAFDFPSSDVMNAEHVLDKDMLKAVKLTSIMAFPNGKCSNRSAHISSMNSYGTDRNGHDIVPVEVFDEWASRMQKSYPTAITFIKITLPEREGFSGPTKDIRIPIKFSYKGYCKNYVDLCDLIVDEEGLKNPRDYRKPYEFNPGLVRVYNYLHNQILTEYFAHMSPRREKSEGWIITDNDDRTIKPFTYKDVSKKTYEGIREEVLNAYDSLTHR